MRLFRRRPPTQPICSCEQCLATLAFLTSCEGIQALLAAAGDAESLVRLGACSRHLRHSVFSCCVDWMQLGLGQAVSRLGENHIFFGASP